MVNLEKRVNIFLAFKDIPTYGLFEYLHNSCELKYGMTYSNEKDNFIELPDDYQETPEVAYQETIQPKTRPSQTYLNRDFVKTNGQGNTEEVKKSHSKYEAEGERITALDLPPDEKLALLNKLTQEQYNLEPLDGISNWYAKEEGRIDDSEDDGVPALGAEGSDSEEDLFSKYPSYKPMSGEEMLRLVAKSSEEGEANRKRLMKLDNEEVFGSDSEE